MKIAQALRDGAHGEHLTASGSNLRFALDTLTSINNIDPDIGKPLLQSKYPMLRPREQVRGARRCRKSFRCYPSASSVLLSDDVSHFPDMISRALSTGHLHIRSFVVIDLFVVNPPPAPKGSRLHGHLCWIWSSMELVLYFPLRS